MNYVTRNIAARLGRLEKLAGKDSCPSCRLERREAWPGPSQDPALYVIACCGVCGRSWAVSLESFDEGRRPMLRLYAEVTAEDVFTDPRAWAAREWILSWEEVLRTREWAARRIAASYGFVRAYEERPRVRTPEVKLRAHLEQEALAKRDRVFKRLRARYGENPFPELAARIAAIKSPDYNALYKGEPFAFYVSFGQIDDIECEAGLLLKCAEAERIALGDVLPSTSKALEDCERRALRRIAEGRQKYEELEAKRQKDEAERERSRLEWLERKAAASTPAPPAQPVAASAKPAAETLAVSHFAPRMPADMATPITFYQPNPTRRSDRVPATARSRRVRRRY